MPTVDAVNVSRSLKPCRKPPGTTLTSTSVPTRFSVPVVSVRHAGQIRRDYGRLHERPVGPHPDWSCQLAFGPEKLGDVVGSLALNRGGLVVLVDPETGDAVTPSTRAGWGRSGLWTCRCCKTAEHRGSADH